MANLTSLLDANGAVHDEEIVARLQDRFSHDLVHSHIGSVNLVSINPYKRVFVPAHTEYDLEKICADSYSVQPHPFDIASAAYLHMVRAVEDQVILTCGESGSGKTEILRQVLQQIVHLSQQTDPQTKIHSDILKTEIVLECFGNAETAKNKNSTRYSRYSELRFNDDGTIVGAKIQEYLFDSSRVPDCPAEDCNFHIFYMLVNGATSEERTKWLLPSNDTKSYHIFKGKRTSTMTEQYPQIDVLKKSLKSLGFSKRNINELLNTIAGIIHLMNVEFTMEEQGKGYGAYVKNKTELEAAAKLFSVSADKLEASITTASYLDGDTICSAFLDVEKSCKARNSLADVIYHLVFKWIIEQINVHLGTSRIGGGVFVTQIGLLDIAGFEDRSPHSNNFDQFMCNYANEKLQTFLLKRSINFIPFTVAADGVSATGFCRPQPVDTQILDFYDDPSTGLFQIVDQETYTKGENAKDLSLLANIEVCFGSGKSRFYESGSDGHSFKVKHYTGKGTSYDIHGFVSKNRNNFYSDVINLFGVTLGTTTGKQKPRTFIAGLFTESVVKAVLHPKDGATMVSARPAAPQGPSLSMEGGARKKSSSMLLSCSSLQSTNSLAGQKKHKVAAEAAVSALSCLKTSIDVLLDALNEMRSWTIVCINPNDTAEPDRFDFNKVLKQIQSYKVREITQASAFDYTVGIEFVDFMERFGKVHADVSVSQQSAEENCRQICTLEQWQPKNAQCGKTRIFLSEQSWRNFESRLDRLSNQMDESEGRKIYLITDQKGVQCTPGFIRKSMGSINALDDTEKKADDLKLEDDEIMHKKSKSIFSLHKRKHSDETDVEEELAKSAEPAAEKPKIIERMSKTRRQWVYFTWCVTWWIPDYLLHKLGKMSQPGVRMAWREKVAICFIVAMLSAVMLFFVQGLGKLLCPLENYFSLSELSAHSKWGGMDLFVAYNGYIYDITGFSHPGGSIIDSAGLDVSSYFPRFNAESGVPFSNHCGFLTTIQTPVNALPSKRDQYENRRMSQSSSGSLAERDDLYTFSPDPTYLEIDNTTSQLICSMPSLPEYIGWCHDTVAIDEFVLKNEVKNVAQVGLLAFPHTELQKHNTVDDWWVAINGKIYNISVIAGSNTIYSIDASQFDINFLGSPGSDASSNSSRLSQSVLQCFDDFLLIGFVDNRASSIGCNASAYILYTVTGIMVAVMVVKFLAALQLGPSPNPEGHDRFVIMQVPCYNEGEASLTKTIQSLATFEYDDTRKLLFIVSDGMIKSAGSDLSTPDIVLQILGVDKSVQIPEAKSYLAIGRGLKEHNKAKVYAGLYSIQARYVPYIYVCKVGKDGETVKPGNRGKRDSQMILMKFINRVHFGTPMSPLELEMYHQIKNIIGVDPFLYEYCLMVDADTRVEAQSLNRLISCMVNDANTMGICGETRIENENESWVTMMQVYEYYISHHLAKAFESLFGSVTCLPGCFCMYRFRTPKKAPLLISNQILNEYKDINVNTLHKQNLLSLGEDRFLTTLMLKHFPEYRNKFTPDAMCYTIVPDTFNMLLGQRRRWINSTIHNLFELIFLPTLCGCLCLSLRLVVFLDLFATLIMPASTAYLIYLIYASIQANQAPIISLIMMASAYGMQAVIFLFKGQYQHIDAYWHFDDFKWGNTRKGAAADTGGGHGSGTDDEELIPLDPSTVPLMTWEAFEKIMIDKGHPGFKSPMSSTNTIAESVQVKVSSPSQPQHHIGSLQGSLNYAPSIAPLDAAKLPVVGLSQSQQFSKENSRQQSRSAELEPAPAAKVPVAQDGFTNQNLEAVPNTAPSKNLAEWTGGFPPDEAIVKFVEHIIENSDLSQLSKKKVREAANAYFKQDLSGKKAFINEVVERIIQG